MDNCQSCLVIKDLGIVLDAPPTHCRACYQRERVKSDQLQAEVDVLKGNNKKLKDKISQLKKQKVQAGFERPGSATEDAIAAQEGIRIRHEHGLDNIGP